MISLHNKEELQNSQTFLNLKKKKSDNAVLVKFAIKKSEFINNLIMMITNSCRPLLVSEDIGFKKLISPIEKFLGIAINRSNIKSHIFKKYNILKNDISLLLCKNIFSIKIDSAKRMGRSFLSLNAQLNIDGKNIIFNLAMKEYFESCTADFMNDFILMTLEKYSCTNINVLSITVDNGASMIKMAKDIQKKYISEKFCFNLMSKLICKENKNENNNNFDEYSESSSSDCYNVEFEEDNAICGVCLIKCAVHTLQLAANDFIQINYQLYNKIKNLTKILRSRKYWCSFRTK